MQIEQAPTSATLQSTVRSGAPRFSAGYAETSRFVRERGATHIIGCASISMTDGGEPVWDPDFNTADLLFFPPLARVATGQARDNHSERKAA
jgi:hypothetical protein